MNLSAKHRPILVFFSAVLAAAAILGMAPLLTKNALFVVGLPFAGAVMVVMFLNVRWAFILILISRALLDPLLEKTRIGGGAGLGGVLNLFLILIAFLLVIRFPSKLKGNRYFVAWVVFLAAALLSVYFAPMRSQALRLWLSLLTYTSMFLAPFFILRDADDKRFWIRLLILSSVIPVGIATLGIVVKNHFLYAYDRLCGTFTHSNILAFYVVLIIALVLYVLRTGALRTTTFTRFLLRLYLLDLFAVLLVTGTRSAWISCAALFFIFGLIRDRRFIVLCVLGAMALAVLPPVRERLADLETGRGQRRTEKLNSFAWRVSLWKDAVTPILQKPVLGHGLASFETESQAFFEKGKGKGAPAHNIYVQMMFEIGLVGLLAYLALHGMILGTFFKAVFAGKGNESAAAAIAASYLIGYMLVGISDNTLFYLAFNWYHWFFMGLLMAATQFKASPPPEEAAA